jgi:hypothetical protein
MAVNAWSNRWTSKHCRTPGGRRWAFALGVEILETRNLLSGGHGASILTSSLTTQASDSSHTDPAITSDHGSSHGSSGQSSSGSDSSSSGNGSPGGPSAQSRGSLTNSNSGGPGPSSSSSSSGGPSAQTDPSLVNSTSGGPGPSDSSSSPGGPSAQTSPIVLDSTGGGPGPSSSLPSTGSSSGTSGGPGGSTSLFLSGPGYPQAPTSGPALSNSPAASGPQSLPLSLPESSVALIPVLLTAAANDASVAMVPLPPLSSPAVVDSASIVAATDGAAATVVTPALADPVSIATAPVAAPPTVDGAVITTVGAVEVSLATAAPSNTGAPVESPAPITISTVAPITSPTILSDATLVPPPVTELIPTTIVVGSTSGGPEYPLAPTSGPAVSDSPAASGRQSLPLPLPESSVALISVLQTAAVPLTTDSASSTTPPVVSEHAISLVATSPLAVTPNPDPIALPATVFSQSADPAPAPTPGARTAVAALSSVGPSLSATPSDSDGAGSTSIAAGPVAGAVGAPESPVAVITSGSSVAVPSHASSADLSLASLAFAGSGVTVAGRQAETGPVNSGSNPGSLPLVSATVSSGPRADSVNQLVSPTAGTVRANADQAVEQSNERSGVAEAWARALATAIAEQSGTTEGVFCWGANASIQPAHPNGTNDSVALVTVDAATEETSGPDDSGRVTDTLWLRWWLPLVLASGASLGAWAAHHNSAQDEKRGKQPGIRTAGC